MRCAYVVTTWPLTDNTQRPSEGHKFQIQISDMIKVVVFYISLDEKKRMDTLGGKDLR
jgi:hypothetical protein